MNIKYRIIESVDDKNKIKEGFQKFFLSVFDQALTDEIWEHQFLRSPYGSSSLFLAMHEDNIVGSALMIPQKLIIDGKVVDYFLYTTSAVSKSYRPKGVYVELLSMQREYCSSKGMGFIFAFPNKLAYPVLKLFGGFKDLTKTNLVKTKLSEIDLFSVDNSFVLDAALMQWRFEHKKYNFFYYKKHVLFVKLFEGNLDLLAIYPEKDVSGLELELEIIDENQTIVTLETFLKKESNTEKLAIVTATYFPVEDLDYSNVKINLLMSDVF